MLQPRIESDDHFLARFEQLRQAIAAITTVEEAKQARDEADTLSTYIRDRGMGLTLQNFAVELRMRAERRLGELLVLMEKNPGVRSRFAGSNTVLPPETPTYRELGLSKMQVSRWMQAASVPEPVFDQMVAEFQERQQLLTNQAVVRKAQELKRQATREANQELVRAAQPIHVSVARQSFPTIVMDPPWDWGDEGDVSQFGRGDPTYATIPFDDLLALPVAEVAEANSHLYLWITNRSLPKGFQLLEAWGFRYITCLTWCKPSIGMGNYFRGSTEHVLFGVRGRLSLLESNIGTWFAAPRGRRHSAKPDEFYEIVQRVSPSPWLDWFARAPRSGWVSYGAELD